MGLLDDEVDSLKRSWGLIKGLKRTFNNNPANREFMDAAFGFGGIAPGVGVPSSMAEAKYRLGQGDYLAGGLAGLGAIPGMALVTKGVKGAKPLVGILEDAVRDAPKTAKQAALDTIKGDVVKALDRTKTPMKGRGPQSGPFVRSEASGTVLGHNAKARFALREQDVADKGGLSAPAFIELKDTPQGRKAFADAGKRAKASIGDTGAQVDIYDRASDYAGTRLFMTEDGTVGFGIKPDGDIVSVFKNADAPPGANVGSVATLLATQEGGRKLDAFDGFLPSSVYGPAGYEHRSGVPFNREHSPSGWKTESMGEPNVSAMAFTPDTPAPYPKDPTRNNVTVPGLLADYNEALATRDRSGIWTPELTPGVSDRLHTVTSMPATMNRNRTTVSLPSRKAFPGIFDDPRDIVDSAAAKIAPENPDMLAHFGANRQDLDDMTRSMQREKAANNVVIPVYIPTGKASANEYLGKIMNPRNEQRIGDVLSLAAADPRFAGSYGWYMLDPLRDRFVAELGQEEGLKRFDDFMQISSALSARASPHSEVRRASLANEYLHSKPQGLAAFYGVPGDALPQGYGSLMHSSAHRGALQRFEKTGRFFDDNTMLVAPKTPNYYYSKTGENIIWPTQDAHYVRGIGLADARPQMNGFDASIGQTEAGAVRDWWRNKIAIPLGMEGSPAQALAWNAFSQGTGVQGNIGKPLLEIITDSVGRQARHTGKSFEQTLSEFIRGQGRLRQVAPVAGTAGMYGLLSGDEDVYQ